MKAIRIASAICSIYFAVLGSVYTQDEGKKAAVMGLLMSIMFHWMSIIFNNSNEDKKDSNNSADMR